MRKKCVIFLIACLPQAPVSASDLLITKLDSQRQLTWTSPTNNAVYTIESAQSLKGPWWPTLRYTNESGVWGASLSNVTKVWLDTNAYRITINRSTNLFYRVVWYNAPRIYSYRGFDERGSLVVTGMLQLVSYPGTNAVYVTYDTQRADNGTNYLGLFVGHREAAGQLSQTGLTNIYNVKFDTDWLCSFSGLAIFVQRTTRNGRLVTTNVSGSWGSTGYFGPAGPRGTFQADPVQ